MVFPPSLDIGSQIKDQKSELQDLKLSAERLTHFSKRLSNINQSVKQIQQDAPTSHSQPNAFSYTIGEKQGSVKGQVSSRFPG